MPDPKEKSDQLENDLDIDDFEGEEEEPRKEKPPIDDEDQRRLMEDRARKNGGNDGEPGELYFTALDGDEPADKPKESGAGTAPASDAQAKLELHNSLQPAQARALRDLIEPNSRKPVADLLTKVDLQTMQTLVDVLTNAPPKTPEGKALLQLAGGRPANLANLDITTLNNMASAIKDSGIGERAAGNARDVLGASANAQLNDMSAAEMKSYFSAMAGRNLNPDQVKYLTDTLARRGQPVADAVKALDPAALKNIIDLTIESQPEAARIESLNRGHQPSTPDHGGHRYQRWLYAALQDRINAPPPNGGPSLAEQGWRLVPGGNQSVGDRAGMDFVLFNTQTGQWLPLDVTEKAKDGAKDKVFCKQYNSGMFDHKTGKLKPEPGETTTASQEARLHDWLNDYIEQNKDKAFDMKDFRPLDLNPVNDPRERQRIIDDYRTRMNEERQKLRDELAREREAAEKLVGGPRADADKRIDSLQKRLDGFNALEREQVNRASGHIGSEVDVQRLSADGLRKYIEQHRNHFNRSSSRPAPDTMPSADATGARAREYVRLENGEIKAFPEGGAVRDGKTYHAGTLDQAIDMAVDGMNIPDAEKTALKKNLKAADPALKERLVAAIREEMTREFEPLRTALNSDRNAARIAAYAGDDMVQGRDVLDSMDKVTKELFNKRYNVDLDRNGKPVLKEAADGKYSLADLIRGDTEIQKQFREQGKNNELSMLRGAAMEQVARGMTGMVRAGFLTDSAAALATRLGIQPAQAEAIFARAEVSVGTNVEPGKPQVVFKNGTKPFVPVHFDGTTFITADGQRVKLADTKIEVNISASSDLASLQTDLINAGDTVLRQVSERQRRAALKTMSDADFKGHEADARDRLSTTIRDAQKQRLQPLFAEAEAIAIANGKSWPPSEAERMELLLEARIALEERKTPPEQLREFDDYLDRLTLEEQNSSASRKPAQDLAMEMFNGPPRPQDNTAGLWQPGTGLETEAARRARQSLERFGPNPLATPELMNRYLERMRAEVQSWGPEGLMRARAVGRLNEQVNAQTAIVSAEAERLARQALGPDATADAVAAKAKEFVEGKAKPEGADAATFESQRERMNELKKAHADGVTELKRIAAERATKLQEVANRFAKENGIPEFKIKPVANMDSVAAYSIGNGEVRVPEMDLIANPRQVVEGLYHEMVHVQQDALVLRSLADKHGIDATGSDPAARAERINKLIAEYTEGGKRPLDRAFLDKVLAQRNEEGQRAGLYGPKMLDEKQRQKAEALFESFKQNKPLSAEYAELGNSFRVTRGRQNQLATAPHDVPAAQDLIRDLAGSEGSKLGERLFGSSDPAKWPEEVRKLVSDWKGAAKDGSGRVANFNEQGARQVLDRVFETRLAEINTERQRLYNDYTKPLHEQETHLIGGDMRRLDVDIATGHRVPATAPTVAPDRWNKVGELRSGDHVLFNRSAAPRTDTEVRTLDASFDPSKPKGYIELNFQGKPEGARYFMDANTREVFVYNEVELPGETKLKTMSTAHEVEVLPPAQAQQRLAETPLTRVPTELAAAGHGAPGTVDLLEIDRVTGRLKKTRAGLAGEIPRLGELNERSLDTLIKSWEKDIDEELEKLKNDPTKEKERAELVKQKEALGGVRQELAAGGERAEKVVEHFKRSSQSGAEIGEIPGNVGRWRGRVVVGGGAVLSIGILVAAGLGYYNRVVAPSRRPPPSSSLPSLGR